ncbi:hypothetical protein HPB49_004110 [Dermacentor silvarum]|uniref:Uncharacterized protein n=1 Tax=Dermacentor silvarum TaxID=543639 RepID=A0ACB8DUF4_DERSI|nr:hypothetical protein HPB49_004110 [Dermacentor silvarum]
MLGSSNTALLTFSGGTRPKCVYYMGVEMRCTEYRPTIQMCLECMQEGHRSDVCPNPKNICRGCGLENPPPQGHECEVKCAVCRAAGHETRRCPNKLIAAKRGKTTRQSRSRERSGQRTKKAPGRWFESTEEEDFYRRRSRSRSPHGSRAMSNTPSRDPSSSRASQRSNSPLPKKQQCNCRSSRKAAVLHQFIKNSEIAPDVICLQEVGAKPATLQGYYTLSDPQNSKVATWPTEVGPLLRSPEAHEELPAKKLRNGREQQRNRVENRSARGDHPDRLRRQAALSGQAAVGLFTPGLRDGRAQGAAGSLDDDPLQRDWDEFIEDFHSAADASGDEEKVVVYDVDVKQFRPDDINVWVKDGNVSVVGRSEKVLNGGGKYVKEELLGGIRVPADVEADDVTLETTPELRLKISRPDSRPGSAMSSASSSAPSSAENSLAER